LRDDISGIGLFGSWSRGDADPSSDVDLLIVSKQNLQYEYVDRLQIGNRIFDLNYVPMQWIVGSVPPEIDQKLYELYVLYDRDWSLTTVKDWMARMYRSFGRVDVRCGMHLVDSDVYLSRAVSARSRRDFQSAYVFACTALESVQKILVEIDGLPLSNSHTLRVLEEATEKLGMPHFFASLLALYQLFGLSREDAEKRIRFFQTIWDRVATVTKENASVKDSLHFKTRTNLDYFAKPSFLQGVVARTKALVDSNTHAEATHYIFCILLNVLESYVSLASEIRETKPSYTTLCRCLKETSHPVYETMVEAFRLEDVTAEEADGAIKLAKETALNVRKQRRILMEKRGQAADLDADKLVFQ